MKRLAAVRRESPLRESCDARQDLVGRFRPHERAGGGVVLVEKLPRRGVDDENPGAACWSRQLEAERMLRSLRNNRNGVTNDATDRLAEMMRLRLTTWNGEMVGAILDRAESDSAAWTALTQAAELRAFALTQEDRDAALEEARDRYEAALAPVEEINMEITAAMAVIEKRIDELTSSSRRE